MAEAEAEVQEAPPEAPPAEAPPEAPGSDDVETGRQAEAGYWPQDWRDRMAGEKPQDAATQEVKDAWQANRTRLDRFASPDDVYGFATNAEKMWKQGADPEPFPDDGDEDAQKTWRINRGLPETPSDYEKHFPEGFEVPERDKVYTDKYLEVAHKHNLPPTVTNEIMETVYAQEKAENTALEEMDVAQSNATAELLQDEYGSETKKNLTAAYALIGMLPEETQGLLMNARLGNGDGFINNPDILRWLVGQAYQINPGGITAPAEGSADAKGLLSEKADLEKLMADTRGPYYTDPKGSDGMTNHQRRYAEILKIEENMAKAKTR